MRRTTTLAAVLLALGAVGLLHAQAAKEIDPDRWGLSPTSVFEDPAPPAFTYPPNPPGATGRLQRGFEGAPPQVPHRVDLFLPVTLERNQCRACHDQPAMIGKEVQGSMPPPMSRSHYVEQDGKLSFNFRRHTCVDCHVPQADVPPPVANVFTGN